MLKMASFFTVMLIGLAGTATADHLDELGDRIENRLDERGDRVDRRLDRRGDRIAHRLDRRAERAAHASTRTPTSSFARQGRMAAPISPR